MSDAHEQSVSTQHITQHIAHADTADSADSAGTADTADTADPGALSLGRFLRACSRRIGAGYRRRSCQHRPATRRGCPPHTAAQSRSRNSLRAATPPRSFSQAASHCQPSGRCCLEQVRKGRAVRAQLLVFSPMGFMCGGGFSGPRPFWPLYTIVSCPTTVRTQQQQTSQTTEDSSSCPLRLLHGRQLQPSLNSFTNQK